jgi:multidrug efflux system membrane fusion protein
MVNSEDSRRPAAIPGTAPVPSGRRSFPWLVVIILIVLVVVGVIVWRLVAKPAEAKQGSMRGATGPVPVIIGTVAEKNVPVYLDGIGTVQAFNSVTIRSRVDGQVQKLGFAEGEDIHAGDVVAQIDPAPFQTQLEQAQAKKAQDEAQLRLAEIEVHRNGVLLTNKIVAQDVYDQSRAQANQSQALVKADQAAIDNIQVQLNYTKITSPIDGRTGIRQIDVGNIIRAADSNGIVVVTQVKPISISFTLPEQNLGDIHAQFSKGPLKVLAIDRDNKTILDEGQLAVVDNQIDPTTGTIRLKATFPNPELRLWPGQFVNTRLLLTVRTNATVVKAAVVQRGPDGAYAFIVGEDMTVEMKPVKVAFIEQQDAVIESGLRAGEKVVEDGQYKLQPGAQVKPAGLPATNAPSAAGNSQSSTNRAGRGKRDGGGSPRPPSQ